MNVLKRPQGKEIQIDGVTYKLSPFNLYIWGELEDRLGTTLDKLPDLLMTKQASTLCTILFVFLKDNHPAIKSPSDAGNLITTKDDVLAVSKAITNILVEFGIINQESQ